MEGEQKERINKAIEIAQKIKPIYLIFLGTKLHNKHTNEYLTLQKINIKIVFPTNRTQDSTRTQIKHLAVFLKKYPECKTLIVSTAYHIPRIQRYFQHYSIIGKCDFYPVGKISEQRAQIETEIKKIITYAKKGDLPLLI